MLQQELYEQFSKRAALIKQLEAEQDTAKEAIMADMKKEACDTFKSPFGAFSVATRPTWAYSPVVEAMGETLKATKRSEEQSGLATKTESFHLRYQAS